MNWIIRLSRRDTLVTDEDYDEYYRNIIEDTARQRQTPFASWFPEGDRVYIPFQPETESFDEDVQDVLGDLGYQITDYAKGLCQNGNRVMRIGKVLEMARKKELNNIQQRIQANEIYRPEREIDRINQFYDEVINTFVNSPLRSQKNVNEFYIVISQNPHDVAKMSTGRDWTSCMELSQGAHRNDVYCEVRVGSLVAYLIRANDLDIKQPLARILIRRFDPLKPGQGKPIAIPEESIYGNAPPSFLTVVQNWLNQRQSDIASGFYQRQGGEWSDTFGHQKLIRPKNPEQILEWLEGKTEPLVWYEVIDNELLFYIYHGANEDEENAVKKFSTLAQAKQYVEQHDNPFWLEYKADLMDEEDLEEWENKPKFEIQKKEQDISKQLRNEAVREILTAPKNTYPEEYIDKAVKIIKETQDRALQQVLLQNHPEKLTPEERKNINAYRYYEYIKKMPEGPEKEQLKQHELENAMPWLEDTSLEAWIHRDPSLKEAYERHENLESLAVLWTHLFNKNILEPLELFSPIPEPVTQRLVDFAINKLPSLNFPNEGVSGIINGKYLRQQDRILSNIVSVLWRTNTDTPTVQRFYKYLLPRTTDNINAFGNYGDLNVNNLGYAIARLGENGREFIPWAKQQLQKSKEQLEEYARENANKYLSKEVINVLDKNVEKWLYIIESLEKGKPSGKYRFSKRINWLQKLAQRRLWDPCFCNKIGGHKYLELVG